MILISEACAAWTCFEARRFFTPGTSRIIGVLHLFARGEDQIVRPFQFKGSAGEVAPETEVAQAGLRREVSQELLEEGNLPGRPGVGLPFSRGLFARQKHGVEVDVVRMILRDLHQQDLFAGSLAGSGEGTG